MQPREGEHRPKTPVGVGGPDFEVSNFKKIDSNGDFGSISKNGLGDGISGSELLQSG